MSRHFVCFIKRSTFISGLRREKGYEVIDIRIFADKKFRVSVFVFPPRVYEQSSKNEDQRNKQCDNLE